jgi:7,8-dihydroneopterin aldolase/epimerase/oxygenase
MDHLFLEGLEIPCRVGCTAPERATLQSLRVDVRLYCPTLEQAGRADDLSLSVDYRVATEMVEAVQGQEFLLIERVAELLADVALAHTQVETVWLSLRKRPPVQSLEWAGVQITRTRK